MPGLSLTTGIENHQVDGVPVRVYSAAKTVADCFKFRNKIGLDIAIEALEIVFARKGPASTKSTATPKSAGLVMSFAPNGGAVIGKWWIVNLDIATDPKFDGELRPLSPRC